MWRVDVPAGHVNRPTCPFRSKVLPLFARRTKKLGLLLPDLYLHGLLGIGHPRPAQGDGAALHRQAGLAVPGQTRPRINGKHVQS